MSITFNPTITLVPRPRTEEDHAWDAYFTLKADVDGEFNVANGNGYFIVRDILGFEGNVLFGGPLDPQDVLRSVAAYEAKSGTKEDRVSESGVVLTADGVAPSSTLVEFGRDTRQVQSYLDRLTVLANICVERGAEITWG